MSDSQAYEEVTGSSDGVTVVKRFEEDEFPVPAIAFEFTSDRDEPVQVTLRDTVPDSVAVEDLGFHPEYGSEHWTIDEDEITFEREIEAGGDYTSVYGIRATGTDDVEKFLTRPEITNVDPPRAEAEAPAAGDGGDEVIPESDDEVVRDVISGESEDVPGLDEESDEEIETLDLKDPNEEGSGSGESTTTTESSDEPSEADEADETDGTDESDDTETSAEAKDDDVGQSGGEAVDLDADNLVSALAAEIRQNNVSAEDVKLLRQAFEIAGQEGGSIQARVERLQSDVSDLRAYSDAMEEFLDDNGTAQQLIDDFESDIETVQAAIDQMQSTVADNNEEVTAVSDEVSSLGSDVAEISEEVDAATDEISDVSEDVEDISGDVDNVEATVEDFEDTISNLEDSVADLEDQVTDGDVAERIGELEDELEDLQTWQDQIKETFGG